jgi:YidC/Oxa1 family membrane protein insertase
MFMANYEHQEFFALDTEKKHRNKLVNSKSLKETYENGRIAAFNSQYFALALMNRSDLLPRIEGGNEGPIGGFTFSWETPQPVDQQSFSYDFYFGPKQVDMLRSVDDELTLLIDLGKFSFIGKPLSWAMRAIHGFVFNWGIAIILLTIILRSALAPLALYSMRSMKKMQAIQPKLNAIKEKYKADPARVNQETLALMKSEKANPLSGCLPMLLQIPVFFAIYAMIGSSFELYKEPFFFWIHDLTLKDPYFILPVLGSLVFFVQQRMMPPSPGMDPTQQKMMMFLPLFMTAFMLGMPAGLSLYYFINALCGLAQQLAFMRERTT